MRTSDCGLRNDGTALFESTLFESRVLAMQTQNRGKDTVPLTCHFFSFRNPKSAIRNLLILLVFSTSVAAAPIDIAQIERQDAVDYQKEILPILRKKCLACHSHSERQGGLILETPATIRQGSDNGPAVQAGRSGDSLLLKVASHREEPFMPPPDNDVAAAELTPQELGLLKVWIDQGAKGNSRNATLSPTSWRPLPPGVNPIYAVAVTPDGQYAACSRANQIFIYHVPTGQLVTRLTDSALQGRDGDPRPGIAHLDLVQSLAFNRDGDMLASGGFRNVKLWKRPRDVFRLKFDVAKAVSTVAVSPDGKMLAAGAGDEVQLWDLAGGKLVRAMAGHDAAVTSLRFTADGSRLLSSSLDKTVRMWSADSGELVGRLDTPTAINAIELINTNEQKAASLVAVGGEEKLVRVYNLPTLPTTLANVPAKPTAVAVTTDGKLFAIGNGEGVVKVVDPAGTVVNEWTASGVSVTRLAFHPLATPQQGNNAASVPIVAMAGTDGVVRLWDYQTGDEVDAFHGSRAALSALAFRPDGKQLASGAADGSITAWNVAPAPHDSMPIVLSAEKLDELASFVALSANGKRLATAAVRSGRPVVLVFDLQAREISHTLLGHDAPVRALSFSSDGTRLVSGSADKSARVWDLNNSESPQLVSFHGHGGEVTAVAFNSNASQVVSGSADKTLKLWNVSDAAEIKNFPGHTAAIVGVGFDSANQPVSVAADKTIRTWNPGNGGQVRAVTETQPLSSMAISRDRSRIAVAGADRAVRLYQLNNGQKLASLEGHKSAVTSLSFSADGTRIVSTTAAGATTWDAASGRLLEIVPTDGLASAAYLADVNTLVTVTAQRIERRLLRFSQSITGLTKPVTSLAFHPNGQTVYASSLDGTLRGFNATNGQPMFTANHGAAIRDAALSPDGRFLVSAGEDKAIKIWNSSNGSAAAPTPLPGFTAPVLSVTFTADGTRVLGGSAAPANQILAFEFATRTLEQGFVGPANAVDAIVGLADKSFATLSGDGGLRSWPLLLESKLAAHSQAVTALAVLPTDRKQLFSASLDGTVRHWDTDSARQIRQFSHGGPIQSIAVRPDGQRLASAGSNHSVRLWNVSNGQRIAEMRGDLRADAVVARLTQEQSTATAKRDTAKRDFEAAEKDVPSKTAAAKKTGETLAAATKDADAKKAATVKAEEAKLAAEKVAIEAAAAARKAALAKLEADRLAAETARLAMLAAEKAARFATLLKQSPNDVRLTTIKAEAETKSAMAKAQADAAKAAQAAPAKAVSETAKAATEAAAKVATTQKPYNDALAALRPAEATKKTAAQLNEIAAGELEAAQARVPQAKQKLAAAEAELAAAGKALEQAKQAAKATEQPLHAVAFSPDGRHLATGGDFPVVHQWDAETGAATASYAGHQEGVRCLAFASDHELVSGSADKSALAWKLNPGWRLARAIGDVKDPSRLVNRVLALDFSRDGTQLATGSGEPSRSGEVKIWTVADGTLIRAIENAHDDTVHGVRFSPDGKLIASCGADKYVRTFDTATGEAVRRFEGHTHHVLSVSWQGNGQLLASAGADKVVKTWNANTGDQVRTIAGFNKQVTSLRFVGNTSDIATASGDPIVRSIRSTNGSTIRNFGGAADFMHTIDVTPDGKVVIAGGHDSVLRIWNGANGQVLKNIEPPQPETGDATNQGDGQTTGR